MDTTLAQSVYNAEYSFLLKLRGMRKRGLWLLQIWKINIKNKRRNKLIKINNVKVNGPPSIPPPPSDRNDNSLI